MIVLDSSAIVAIAKDEPEAKTFAGIIASRHALIGAPTAVEMAMVLSSAIPAFAETFLDELVNRPSVQIVDFSAEMFDAARLAFRHFGKGRGSEADLNFGDCMAYAVAKVRGLPLLYKGNDFAQTDIEPAWRP